MSQQPPWPQGQSYPSAQQYPPAGPGYGYAPLPVAVRTSVRGPRAMTIIGATLLVLAVVLLALALPTIVSTVPVHMVDRAGNPGSAAVAGLDAPGTTPVHLEAGYYDVYLASTGSFAYVTGPITVAADGGTAVDVHDPSVTTSFTMIDTYVISVASFHVTRAGEYRVTTPALDLQGATAILGHGENPSTVAAAGLELAGAIVVGLTGLGLTIGGGIWWGRRSGNRKRLAAGPAGYPGVHGAQAGFAPR